MAVNYSAYKMATVSSPMTAANWNAFWALNLFHDTGAAWGYLYNIAYSHSLPSASDVPEYTKNTGDALTYLELVAIVDWVLSIGGEYQASVCHPIYQDRLDAAISDNRITSMESKASGDSVTSTEWNNLLDAIAAIVDIIALSEDVWTFGSNMPMVLV